MNAFMIQLHVIQGPDSEYHAKEANGQEVIAHRQSLDKVYVSLSSAHNKLGFTYSRCHFVKRQTLMAAYQYMLIMMLPRSQ